MRAGSTDGGEFLAEPETSEHAAGSVRRRRGRRPKYAKRGTSGEAVLLIDDDDAFREPLARALRERYLDVTTAASCDAATVEDSRPPFDFAVLDLRMLGPAGTTPIQPLRQPRPQVRIVMLTGYGSLRSAVEAVQRAADDYLGKPRDADQVVASLFPGGAPDSGRTSTPTLAMATREHVYRVLADCGGNISQAARRLGITRRTLQLKLKRYRLAR